MPPPQTQPGPAITPAGPLPKPTTASAPPNQNQANGAVATPRANPADGTLLITLSGSWRMDSPVPQWVPQQTAPPLRRVQFDAAHLGPWDSSLLLYLLDCRTWCLANGATVDDSGLPPGVVALLRLSQPDNKPDADQPPSRPTTTQRLTNQVTRIGSSTLGVIGFLGLTTAAMARAIHQPRRVRWADVAGCLQQCWVSSIPIVGLVSFLVGVILAFQAAVQLRQFGAAIFVADLVGLGVVREMGPMMAALVVAGSTGAGYAAELGNMRVDEEIDALETFGIPSIDFLVTPRLIAATVMLPLLALYADALGVLGGMVVSETMLDIPLAAYWLETRLRVSAMDLTGGLLKSLVFGAAIALAGCYRGMSCDRTAAGVGQATSSAVVTGLLLIVISDALFALIFNVLGI